MIRLPKFHRTFASGHTQHSGFELIVQSLRAFGPVVWGARDTIMQVSLWLTLGLLAMESKRAQRDLREREELFMAKESRLQREIDAYSKKDMSPTVREDYLKGPRLDENYKPPQGIY